jgi:hypothetical protein
MISGWSSSFSSSRISEAFIRDARVASTVFQSIRISLRDPARNLLARAG